MTIKGDTVREANETFVVSVGSVVGATVGDGQAPRDDRQRRLMAGNNTGPA